MAMATVLDEIQEHWTEDYWLRHCRGFRVEGPDGCLGYVDRVVLDPEEQEPSALVVRGKRAILVPAGEIVRLVPREERVLVC